MSWYVYSELVPIDFNWDLLPTVESVAVTLAKIEAENLVRYGAACSRREPGGAVLEFTELRGSFRALAPYVVLGALAYSASCLIRQTRPGGAEAIVRGGGGYAGAAACALKTGLVVLPCGRAPFGARFVVPGLLGA